MIGGVTEADSREAVSSGHLVPTTQENWPATISAICGVKIKTIIYDIGDFAKHPLCMNCYRINCTAGYGRAT